ncbi:hypothetical protein AJ79_09852 [Helicocarpus griseus UAMH5409]|uniref:Uncharacterized protein n=1 Tax=Helicocarpus griseus UAMH5409 TaxID=1447875 RepID=A0A2B7WGF0_9EURO|nr:hypothetical protein AJ79_09852 [Helicocarpus griseus UAMH5409]
MFDLPGAKRVRREELQSRRSSSRSRSPSPAESTTATYAADALRNLFSSVETYTPPDLHTAKPAADLEHIADEEEEQEFEFKLFRAPTKSLTRHKEGELEKGTTEGQSEQIQKFKIRLRSPTPTAKDREGGLVTPFRGWKYYFSDPEWIRRRVAGKVGEALSVEDDTQRKEVIQQFMEAAVSGDAVLEAKNDAWPGCHMPWRVVHLKTTPSKKPSGSSGPSKPANSTLINQSAIAKVPKSRKKPGKKRRIVIRQRLAAAKTAEEADREKRTRRNREKKIKRRQKEREKKAALREGGSERGSSEAGDAAESDMSD